MIAANARTVGALQRPETPRFPITLRAMAAVRVEPTLKVEMLPPPAPIVKVEPELDLDVTECEPRSEMVEKLLMMAAGLDLTADQPYMPEPMTTLKYATFLLRRQGRILIHGGEIVWNGGRLFCRLTGGEPVTILARDAVALLKASYPIPQWQTRNPVNTRDTLPVEAEWMPRPMPREGVGFWSNVAYGAFVDDIREEEWEPIKFARGVHRGAMYLGDTVVDGTRCDVWWHLALGCHLAQPIPSDELTPAAAE